MVNLGDFTVYWAINLDLNLVLTLLVIIGRFIFIAFVEL